jgi:hypothetical protein
MTGRVGGFFSDDNGLGNILDTIKIYPLANRRAPAGALR